MFDNISVKELHERSKEMIEYLRDRIKSRKGEHITFHSFYSDQRKLKCTPTTCYKVLGTPPNLREDILYQISNLGIDKVYLEDIRYVNGENKFDIGGLEFDLHDVFILKFVEGITISTERYQNNFTTFISRKRFIPSSPVGITGELHSTGKFHCTSSQDQKKIERKANKHFSEVNEKLCELNKGVGLYETQLLINTHKQYGTTIQGCYTFPWKNRVKKPSETVGSVLGNLDKLYDLTINNYGKFIEELEEI
jgi:hypothetical protein